MVANAQPRITPPEGFEFYGLPIDHAIDNYAAKVVSAPTLDPVTFELVRLRCAQYHNCRFCSSARTQSALDSGLDESLVDSIAHYESTDMDEKYKAALRLTDAIIMQPADADERLRDALLEHFTEGQIVEIGCCAVKWSQQKVMVSLGLDASPFEAGTPAVDWSSDHPGNFHVVGWVTK